MGQFTREIGNGMMKQQAGAARNSSLLDIWNHEIQVALLFSLFLQLQDVMESEPHWDLGVLDPVHGSVPKELETKLGSQILSECKWDDHNENDSTSIKDSAAGVLGCPQNILRQSSL